MTTADIEALERAGVRASAIPADPKARYFIRAGGKQLDGGFRNKLQADEWILSHRRDFDWRAGYTFRLKGLSMNISLIDVHGVEVD